MRCLKTARVIWIVLLMGVAVWAFTGCDADPETTEAVVTDGVTDNDLSADREEVLPSVTVYKVLDENRGSFAKYLLSENVEGLGVVFCVRRFGDTEWIRLGNEVIYTNGEGQAALSQIRGLLPRAILRAAPVDIQLQARVYFNSTTYISDDKGIIRVLSSDKSTNPQVVFSDHDNTLHATGGLNAVQDWIDFMNWARNDWPLVDDDVVEAVNKLKSEHRDLVVVTGMPNDVRPNCREQVNRHFENGGRRFIPLILKDDFPYEEANEYKKEALRVLKDLYGSANCLAMVGDTVSQDGYGAVANTIHYVPYQIHYDQKPSLLNTEGFGPIDPDTVTDDWQEVLDAIDNGPVIEDNFFLKRFTGLLNIAHKGGCELLPENTLEAYRNGFAVGADSIDADVHMTRDGVLVISHDDTVDRCTNGTGEIMGMTLEEVKALDAGYWFTTDEGQTYPCRGKGYRIPTLDEVLSDPALKGRPLVLEIKQGELEVTEKVLDMIRAYGVEDNLLLAAFDQETLDLAAELSAERGMNLVLAYSTQGVLKFMSLPKEVLAAADNGSLCEVLDIPNEVLTADMVEKAWYLGKKVHVWTVNDERAMTRHMERTQVDAIETDNPELLEGLINQN